MVFSKYRSTIVYLELPHSLHKMTANSQNYSLSTVNHLLCNSIISHHKENITFIFYFFRLKANQPKNRYTDVLCYDHSRVELAIVDNDPYSDYINANFVDGYKQKHAFISSQGTV